MKSTSMKMNGDGVSPVNNVVTQSGSLSVNVETNNMNSVYQETYSNSNAVVDKDDFTLVQSRKRKNNIIGSKKTTGSVPLRSAVRVGDLYIGNCDFDATVDSLAQYIVEEMKINVTNVEQLSSRIMSSKSFKVTVNMNDRQRLLSPDVWPEGIICR